MRTQGGAEALGTFVEPRGMVRSIVAGTVGRGAWRRWAVFGATCGGVAALGELTDQCRPDCLSRVSSEELILFRVKRGAFRPKATDEVIAVAPRTSVSAAALDRGRLAGVLQVTFADGSTWAFDVPKVHISGAETIAGALG